MPTFYRPYVYNIRNMYAIYMYICYTHLYQFIIKLIFRSICIWVSTCACVRARVYMQYAYYASPRGKFIQKYNARDGVHGDFNS